MRSDLASETPAVNRPSRRALHLLSRTAFFALILTTAAVCPCAAQWPMFHGNPAHTGSSTAFAPLDSTLDWVYTQTDSIFYSSPVIGADGTVYIGTLGEALLAVNRSGFLLWRYDAQGNFRYSTPAIADSLLYMGGGDGRLYSIRRRDGTLRWTYLAAAPIKTSPNVAGDGTVYFGADDGKLYAVGSNGGLKWTYPTGDSIRSSPAIGPDGTVFFGSQDFYLYAVRPDGTLRWRAATGDRIRFCSPAVSDSFVYVGSYDGFLYAINWRTAGLKWAFYTGHNVRASPALGPGGVVYLCAGPRLYALSPGGAQVWAYDTGSSIISSPAYLQNGHVICFGTEGGVFYAIRENGTLAWRYTVGASILSSPAPDPSRVIYVADVSGRLWAFGAPVYAKVDETASPDRGPRVQALPNPSSGAVRFLVLGAQVDLGGVDHDLLILDASGRRVTALHPRTDRTYRWDGRRPDGSEAASGIYFFRLQGSSRGGRLVLLR